jgi:uncharacterized damage-inducible protein DinB
MRELDRIADELRRALIGDAWHGPALREVLVGIDGTDAFQLPPGATHTIHELVLHITVWLDVVRRRLQGEAFEPTATQDWPEAETGQLSWSDALRGLDEAAARLQDTVRSLSDDVLTRAVAGKDYDAYHMLHGVVQHTAYHTGQIALLKRLL